MAITQGTVGGDFQLKFGKLVVEATDYSSNLNPIDYSEQASSDVVKFSAQRKAATASFTLIIGTDTDKAAILDYVGDVTCYNRGTKKLDVLHMARCTGGLEHDHKTGLATGSLVAEWGETLE